MPVLRVRIIKESILHLILKGHIKHRCGLLAFSPIAKNVSHLLCIVYTRFEMDVPTFTEGSAGSESIEVASVTTIPYDCNDSYGLELSNLFTQNHAKITPLSSSDDHQGLSRSRDPPL